MKLLLVEDNRELAAWLKRLLSQSGYAVEQAHSGEEAGTLLLTQHYDAILLDLTLPGIQGQAVLKDLRRKDDMTPVLIISALDSLPTIVEHLDLGADDYLAKPFDITELEARLRSLLRRACGKITPVISCGLLHYDSNAKRFLLGQQDLNPTPREHALLEILIRKQGATVSKKELAEGLCTLDDSLSPKAVEIYILRLRKKLEHSGAQIITLRGLGYMLTHDAAA